jgi:acyl-coenzyme A thioesterase PaaI-like protein
MPSRTSQPANWMTQIKKSPHRTTQIGGPIMVWWSRLEPLPAGRLMYSLALGWLAPYSGNIGARVEEIRPGYARVRIKDRRRLRNHLRSMHAIALVNLGELATGLAVLSTLSADMRGIVLDIQAEYVKKARGRITAIAEFELPPLSQDDTACKVEACLQDQDGETVARVRATWLIGYRT